jgi:predicted nucleotidyltransferase
MDHFAGAILYGSYARGEENEDSDIDILVLLTGMEVSPFTEIDRMGALIGRLNSKYNQLIILAPVQKEQFETFNFPIYKSIKKEGIWI